MTMRFKDRAHAAAELSSQLKSVTNNIWTEDRIRTPKEKDKVTIMAIPRGGVVTADVVAYNLKRKLDIVISTKIGAPFNSEIDIGAVAHDGSFFPNRKIINSLKVPQKYIDEQISLELKKIVTRLLKLRGSNQYQIDDKIIVLVDDGVCTGVTMSMAATWVRSQNIEKLIIAVPVAPRVALEKLKEIADIVVVLHASRECEPVGEFYQYFPEVSDQEVLEIMQKYRVINGKTS
jgi:putative phosphoribosyl transferase